MTPVPRVVVVAGPTASGKSALALCLAEALGGTIINADSIQCYRDLPILTARPTDAELQRVSHQLYGVLGPEEKLSAAAWASMAAQAITASATAGRQPIVVGGTGFYLKALIEGLADIPAVPDDIRTETKQLLKTIGSPALHQKLLARDPVTAARLKPTDTQRIARAWEVLEATDTPLSTWQSQPAVPALNATYMSVLIQPPRKMLYQTCDDRFVSMLDRGAADQVGTLLKSGVPDSAPIMRALGATELTRVIRHEIKLPEAVTLAQATTRHYAKRQATWFRHQFHADYTLDTKFSESLFDKIFPEIRHLLLT
ncbi:MAG: tRNA (adenosine(37)-N6)-dimethylallyltransferase MiaA [Rhodospirillaceae bacterium]|nr:tRNA (adenosine(37)-N6)-dimethylallyltransferase MiaA [Rhodospirillaceae bacterium]